MGNKPDSRVLEIYFAYSRNFASHRHLRRRLALPASRPSGIHRSRDFSDRRLAFYFVVLFLSNFIPPYRRCHDLPVGRGRSFHPANGKLAGRLGVSPSARWRRDCLRKRRAPGVVLRMVLDPSAAEPACRNRCLTSSPQNWRPSEEDGQADWSGAGVTRTLAEI